MALPPFVIVHGTNKTTSGKPIYLGAGGWVAQREMALSFFTKDAGLDWIKTASIDWPALRTAGAIVSKKDDPRMGDEYLSALDRKPRVAKELDPYSDEAAAR